jgi:hypothetical protein
LNGPFFDSVRPLTASHVPAEPGEDTKGLPAHPPTGRGPSYGRDTTAGVFTPPLTANRGNITGNTTENDKVVESITLNSVGTLIGNNTFTLLRQ